MAKNLTDGVLTEIVASYKKPRLLFEIFLDGVTLLYAGDKSNITFPHGGVTTYVAKAVEFGGYSQNMEGQIGRINVKFDNVLKDLGVYVSSYDFEGRILVIKRVYLDDSFNAPTNEKDYNQIFSGVLEAPKKVDRYWAELTATIGKPLKRKALLDSYTRECKHTFGDPLTCNVDDLADLSTLIITGGGVSSGSATTLCSTTAFSQVTDYWNYGHISIGISGTTFLTKVGSYGYSVAGLTGTITFDVTLPLSVTAGSVFEVKKGCDKTWETCGASRVYGPTADNTLNFGGFTHIGTTREAT